jgi:hypothetical protein
VAIVKFEADGAHHLRRMERILKSLAKHIHLRYSSVKATKYVLPR